MQQITHFDPDCGITEGPVEFVLSGTFQGGTVVTDGDLSGLAAGTSSAAPRKDYFTHSEIQDRVGILLNALHTSTSWEFDENVVLRYTSGGWYAWQEEAWPSRGWRPRNVSNGQENGCVGCDFVTLHAHVEFDYQGGLDPTGTLFYNKLDNRPTVKSGGAATCKIDLWAKRYSGLWKDWIKRCGPGN